MKKSIRVTSKYGLESESKLPSLFHELIESTVVLNGKPFRLDEVIETPAGDKLILNRNYLKPIYNMVFPELVLLFARQCEKSTTCANIMLGTNLIYPYYKWMFVSASLQQVSEFSKDKFDSRIMESPILKSYFYSNSGWSVYDKYLKSGGNIKLRGMFRGPDRTRGASVDGLIFDEVQDILYDDMLIAYETQSHSNHKEKRRIFAGTPKTISNTLEQLRKKSKYFERVFICEHCGKDQIIEIDNIGPDFLECKYCHKNLSKSKQKWVLSEDNSDSRCAFRIPQVIVPWKLHNPNEWKVLYNDMLSYPENTFLNEKLALSAGHADQPVTEDMLKMCCRDDLEFLPPKAHQNVVMGVDYGRGSKSYTVVAIVQILNNTPHLIYAKKFRGRESDSVVYMQQLKQLFTQYNAICMGVDSGDGFHQNKELKYTLGHDKVIVFEASGNLKEDTRWNNTTKQFSFSRTKQLDKRFAEISLKKVVFPKWSVFQEFGVDFLGIYSEERSNGKIIFDHPEDSPDDFVHAWNYAIMCAENLGIWISPIRYDAKYVPNQLDIF